MIRYLKNLTIIVFVSLITGCATTGGAIRQPIIEEIPLPLAGGLSSYKSASIEMSNPGDNYAKETETLEAAIGGQLRNKGIFEPIYFSLTRPAENPDLKIKVVVISSHFISDWQAGMGVMSGGAGITLYLEFWDTKTNAIIGRKLFEASAGGMEFAYTEHVVRKITDQIITYVEENTKR